MVFPLSCCWSFANPVGVSGLLENLDGVRRSPVGVFRIRSEFLQTSTWSRRVFQHVETPVEVLLNSPSKVSVERSRRSLRSEFSERQMQPNPFSNRITRQKRVLVKFELSPVGVFRIRSEFCKPQQDLDGCFNMLKRPSKSC
jgi:hypothetical protein